MTEQNKVARLRVKLSPEIESTTLRGGATGEFVQVNIDPVTSARFADLRIQHARMLVCSNAIGAGPWRDAISGDIDFHRTRMRRCSTTAEVNTVSGIDIYQYPEHIWLAYGKWVHRDHVAQHLLERYDRACQALRDDPDGSRPAVEFLDAADAIRANVAPLLDRVALEASVQAAVRKRAHERSLDAILQARRGQDIFARNFISRR